MGWVVYAKIIQNKFDVSSLFAYLIYMNLTLDNLKLDQVDCIDSNVVNVFCLFDTGKSYYEGGLSADVVISEEDGFIFADAVKVNFVEDEDEKEIEFVYDAKELEKKIEYNLNNVMNSPMTNENERQLIDALS